MGIFGVVEHAIVCLCSVHLCRTGREGRGEREREMEI